MWSGERSDVANWQEMSIGSLPTSADGFDQRSAGAEHAPVRAYGARTAATAKAQTRGLPPKSRCPRDTDDPAATLSLQQVVRVTPYVGADHQKVLVDPSS